MMEEFTTDSGLRILLCNRNNTDTAVIALRIGGGSRYENDSINGISHFLEHMLFEGTKKYPSRELFNSYVESVGFGFNAETCHESILLYSYFPDQKISEMLCMLSEMIFSPLLSERAFNLEKKIILDEINEDNYSLETKYQNIFYKKNIYKDSFIGLGTSGNRKNIRNFKIKDIKEWHKKLCRGKNMTLCVSADFKKNPKIRLIIKKYFSKNGVDCGVLEKKMNIPQSRYRVLLAPNADPKEKNIDFQFNTQSYFDNQEDILKLDLIENIIGAYMHDFFRQKLNLTYGCHFNMAPFSDIQTWHLVFVGNFAKITKILPHLFEALENLLKMLFSESFFQNSKDRTIFNFDSMKDDAENFCRFASEEKLLFDNVINIEKIRLLIGSMSKKDVEKYLRIILAPKNFNFLFYGNITSQQGKKLRNIIENGLYRLKE